jgi:hypothetical protein
VPFFTPYSAALAFAALAFAGLVEAPPKSAIWISV